MNFIDGGAADSLRSGSASAVLKTLGELDSRGLFLHPGETPPEFAARLEKLSSELDAAADRSSDLAELAWDGEPIPESKRAEAGEITMRLYRFDADWVRCRFSSKNAGFPFAGTTVFVDSLIPLVFLPGKFRSRGRLHGYSMAETLAHELCHAARTGFPRSAFDEFFSFHTDGSGFRRLCGNLFRSPFTAICFLAPPVLSAAAAALWGFSLYWTPILIPSVWIVLREWRILRMFSRAKRNLSACGFDAMPLLFRMTDGEIAEAAADGPGHVSAAVTEWSARSVRWRFLASEFGE